jgi:2-dehydro-3-deoxyphosphogluconate aldolase/(4S)-4-hydroxy-2-oxoglutarate aldolase
MIERIAAKKIVPVVVLDDANDALPLAEALLAGGLDIIEITFRTAAAEESLRRIAATFPEMLLGAGTLLNAEQARAATQAGAVFGLAPGLNPQVVQAAAECGLAFAPGVVTPSEIERAIALGCRLLKFFPAEAAGGPPMLKALAGPYLHTGVRFIPTGGIDRINATRYLKLPFVVAVGGTWMVDKACIAAGHWRKISQLAKDAIELATEV